MTDKPFLTSVARSVFLLTCIPGALLVVVRIWILIRWSRGLSPLGDWPGTLLLGTILTAPLSTGIAVILFAFWRKSFLSGSFGLFARVAFWTAVVGILITFAPRLTS